MVWKNCVLLPFFYFNMQNILLFVIWILLIKVICSALLPYIIYVECSPISIKMSLMLPNHCIILLHLHNYAAKLPLRQRIACREVQRKIRLHACNNAGQSKSRRNESTFCDDFTNIKSANFFYVLRVFKREKLWCYFLYHLSIYCYIFYCSYYFYFILCKNFIFLLFFFHIFTVDSTLLKYC